MWLGGGWRLDQHTDTVATAWNTNVMPRPRPRPNQPPRYRLCFLQRGLPPACSCIRLLLYPASAFPPATWRLAYGTRLGVASSPATALSRARLPGFLDALLNSAYRHCLEQSVDIARTYVVEHTALCDVFFCFSAYPHVLAVKGGLGLAPYTADGLTSGYPAALQPSASTLFRLHAEQKQALATVDLEIRSRWRHRPRSWLRALRTAM